MIDELVDIYLNYEGWHKKKLDKDEARRYFEKLIEKERIDTVLHNGKLLGYVESWRLDFDQFGRLICGAEFSSYSENVTDGPIAVCANTFIWPQYRHTWVYKSLKTKFFKGNEGAIYFTGQAERKQAQMVKVLKKIQRKVMTNGKLTDNRNKN